MSQAQERIAVTAGRTTIEMTAAQYDYLKGNPVERRQFLSLYEHNQKAAWNYLAMRMGESLPFQEKRQKAPSEQKVIPVPQELLDALPAVVEAQKKHKGVRGPLGALLAEVAKCYGISSIQGNNWNDVIDLLDRDYPGWRGYSVPETERRHIA